jgi:hypothetical protein
VLGAVDIHIQIASLETPVLIIRELRTCGDGPHAIGAFVECDNGRAALAWRTHMNVRHRPSIPAVLMVPLTDLSAATVIVPVPDADVVTGGVSSAPVKFSFRSTAKAEPPITTSATEATSMRTLRGLNDLCIIYSRELFFEWIVGAGCDVFDVESHSVE